MDLRHARTAHDRALKRFLSKARIPITLPLLSKAAPLQPTGGGRRSVSRDPGRSVGWHFMALGGGHVDRSMFPSTEVAALHGIGTHATEAHQPLIYQKYKVLKDATDHQRQGLGCEDTRLSLING